MKKNNNFSKTAKMMAWFSLPLLLVSCGTYYNVSYYDDGIYADTPHREICRTRGAKKLYA
ncbi:hypothetical protein QIU18_13485 [Capnocytophaga canimorsus]|nr:hypothetical protein [Capnocytophaga canimorsus]WGU70411.1 hypothetical protein QIU18_13485 [Capnocytophaga canimorsus]